MQLMLIHQFIS